MNLSSGWILAAAAAPAGELFKTMGFMVIILALLYFMMIRPQAKKEKERKKMIEAIKTGDRILFAGGLLGIVANVKEHLFVVKIAENVKIEIARGSVLRVLDKGEEPTDLPPNA